MTQQMELMDLSDEDDQDESVVGYLKLMPPHHRMLGWETMEIKDGETTVGRDEDQDITITNPTVSGRHASIDVVDLPGGGKCITVKDLRSTNGTFMVDVDTGENTRLAPRKATVLPEDGCQIYFGAVLCKLAPGPAPNPSSPGDQMDEATKAGVYDIDTQPPVSCLDDDGGKAATSGGASEGDKKGDTAPLAPVEEEVAPGIEGGGVEGTGVAGVDADQKKGGVDQSTDDDVDTVQDDDEVGGSEESKVNVEGEMVTPEGAVGGRTHEPRSEGICFGELGIADNPEGGGAVVEDGGAYEPPTQAIAKELDQTVEDIVEDKPGMNASGESSGHHGATSTPASAAEGGASAAGGASDDATSRANRTSSQDDGEDTADEGETARLFEDDDEMDEVKADAHESVHHPDQEVTRDSTFAATPLTPRQEAQNATSKSEIFSPGGASEASTQRQEMREEGSDRDEAGGQEQTGRGVKHTTDSGDAVRASVKEKEVAMGGQMNKEDEMSDDEDDMSDASEALIPAQDIEHLEGDYMADMVAQKQAEEASGQEARAGDVDAGGGGDAVAPDEDVADGSGSETEATEIDTDDGPTGDVPERNVAGEELSSAGPDGASVINGASGEAAPRQEPKSPEEIRTPGGTVLRRASTEDTMMAMAMEQHRTHAARSVAAAAREGALAMEYESNENRLTDKADGTDEEEAETQAVPMDEEDVISETGAIGTEIVEETAYPDVLGDDAMVALTDDCNAEQSVATSDSFAAVPRTTSDDVASAVATDGDDSSRFGDLIPARGTVGIVAEREDGGASLGAEKKSVEEQLMDEGFDELEGRRQLGGSNEQGDGGDVGDNCAKEEEIIAEREDSCATLDVEEKEQTMDEGFDELEGRRQLGGSNEHGDGGDVGDNSAKEEEIVAEREDGGASLGAEKKPVQKQTMDEGFDELEGRRQLGGSNEQGDGGDVGDNSAKEEEIRKGKEDPEAGKSLVEADRGVQRGAQAPLPHVVPRTSGRQRRKPKAFDEVNDDSSATPKPVSEKKGKGKRNEGIPQPETASPEAGDATPLRRQARSTKWGGTPQPSKKLDKDLTTPTAASRRGPAKPAIKTRSRKVTPDGSKSEQEHKSLDRMTKSSSKRRRGEVSSGTPDSPASIEPDTPASMGRARRRLRGTAADSYNEKGSDTHGGDCAGSKVAGLRRCVRERAGSRMGNSGTDREFKGKGKGNIKSGRKREAECDDEGERGQDMEGSNDCFGSTGKGEADGEEDEIPSTPPPTPGSGRRSRTGGARATYSSSRVASALSRRGKFRTILEEEKSASPSSLRVSGRSKGRALTNASSSSVGAESEASANVKVCFTNVKPTSKERSCMKKLGISEVEDVLEATHLVAGGRGVPLKRTPKLLAGIGRCEFVVDVEWLYQSAKEGRVLNGIEYVLCDSEAEKKWEFNMRTSLCRRPDTGLLAGISIFVDPAVAGTKGMGCPPLDEMKMVVTSAGGRWMPKLPKRGGPDPQSLLVITHPNVLAASGKRGAKSSQVLTAGRHLKAFLPEMLFLCILRQRMSWPDELAVETGQGGEAGTVAQKAKPAKRRRT